MNWTTPNTTSFPTKLPAGVAPGVEAKLVSDEVTDLVENVLAFTMLAINLVGVATNVINLRVFVKQGVRSDSTTLSLFSLSLFDLLGAACLLPLSCCYILRFLRGKYAFISCRTITLLTTTVMHSILFSISSWTTVYMSVERSLCVLMPMKVKSIFKVPTTFTAIVCIFVGFVAANVYVMAHIKIRWQTVPHLKSTFAVPYKSPRADTVKRLGSMILMTGANTAALVVVVVTTSLMLHQLNKSRKWRQATTAKTAEPSKNDETGSKRPSNKDVQVLKTVVTVTSVFLVCLSMGHVPSTSALVLPALTFSGANQNFLSMMTMIKFFSDSVNTCVNFFFYIRVSSRYKATFTSLYPSWAKE